MCRQQIPVDFDKNPNVLDRQEIDLLEDGFQWFYEGKNGMKLFIVWCRSGVFNPNDFKDHWNCIIILWAAYKTIYLHSPY